VLFLDTEFSKFGGELISIALVSDNGELSEFYAVRHLPSKRHPWVDENVVPVLLKDPEPDHLIRSRLVTFLRKHSSEPIIADWPEDFIHLLYLLCEPNGSRANVDLDLRLITSGDVISKIPHNALSDARGLMHWYKKSTMTAPAL
jgi:hypothetical protein